MIAEVNKPYDELVDNLVNECVDFLMELEGNENRLAKEEIQKNINDITIIEEPANTNPTKGRRVFKRTLLVAACLAILLLIMTVAAASFETDIVSILKKWGSTITQMAAGDKCDVGGNTIIKPEHSASYNTIEEFLSAEGVHILYPTYLPDGAEIQRIEYLEYGEIKEVVFVQKNVGISVEVKLNGKLTAEEQKSTRLIANYSCHVIEDTTFVQAKFIYQGNVYLVMTDSYDETVKIIENLKELIK